MTYDAIGNPLSYRHYTLTWQNGRQLASLQIMQLKINYTYDVDGLRTSKSVPNIDLEHKYYYVGSRLQYEDRGNGNALWYFYDADGTPSGIRYRNNGGVVSDYYFVCNWRGDVIQIYNTAGELVSTYDYDAWGNVTAHETDKDTYGITNINPIRYRGYYYDTETGMYYLKSRYYDPAAKRFLNADGYVATGQGILEKNMFAYCLNDPVIKKDSLGTFTLTITACAIIGMVCIGFIGVCFWASTASQNVAYSPSLSLPGIDIRSKYKSNVIDIAPAIPKKYPRETKIYRYGGTNPGNLTPRQKDVYSGLSFSTIPPLAGFSAAVTTIEELNLTGIVIAIQDSPTHVSVRPIGATTQDWIDAGSESVWTKAVKSVVVKWDGVE